MIPGPYSQCLEVANLKRRSEDSEAFPWDEEETIPRSSRGLKRYQSTKVNFHSGEKVGNNSTQTVLCACQAHHIG